MVAVAFQHGWPVRLLIGALVLVVSFGLARILHWRIDVLAERRAENPRLLRRLQRRETVAIVTETLLRYGALVFAVFWLIGIFVPDTTAAIGGASLIVVVVGFGAQRVLQDAIAGFGILFEGWYAVGDFVSLRPMEVVGFVEEVGFRTTVVRSLNGDRNYVPNSQIIGAVRNPRGYRTYTMEIVTTDPEVARGAVESAAKHAPTGRASFLRPPTVIDEKELGEGTWLVRARADVPPSLEWLAEGLLVSLIRAQIPEEALIAGPVVYTLDDGAVERYQRRVLVR